MRLLAELKRRNVIRMAGLYLLGAWMIVQVAETLLPIFNTPAWVLQGLVVLLAVGLVPAMILSWVFELTPEGLRRDVGLTPGQTTATPARTRRLDRLLLAGAVVVITLLVGERWLRPRPAEVPAIAASVASPGTALVPPADAKTIAVLPFANLSTQADDAFFALGIHDEVLTDLAQIADLRVIARASVMGYRDSTKTIPEIAGELGVAMVLDGTISRSGDRVRVQVRLNDAASNAVVWSQRFDEALTAGNLFEIQSKITREIAAHLGSNVSAQERSSIDTVPTRSTAAYDAFLRGKVLARYGDNTEQDLIDALAAFDTAVAEDPEFAAAYAAKAIVHMSLFWSGNERDANITAARLALERATLLSPDSADTLVAFGFYHYWGFLDYEQAEVALARALAIAPNNADAWAIRGAVARRALRFDDAIAAFERCQQLDPLRPGTRIDLAVTTAYKGDLRKAMAIASHARAQAPRAAYVIGNYIAVAILAGDLDAAWLAAKDLPVLDSGAYDYVRSTLALYSSDSAKLNALMATWPKPRETEPYYNHFDLMRVFALRQMHEDVAASALLVRLRARVEAQLADDPGDVENRRTLIAVLGLAGDRERLRAADAALMADPPKDNLWVVEEGFVIVLGNAIAGESEAAFDLVELLMDRAGAAQFARVEAAPAFDPLRSEPRYLALRQRYRTWKTQAVTAN